MLNTFLLVTTNVKHILKDGQDNMSAKHHNSRHYHTILLKVLF